MARLDLQDFFRGYVDRPRIDLTQSPFNKSIYVPTDTDVFEIPQFAMRSFSGENSGDYPDGIMFLSSSSYYPTGYKTPEAIVKNGIRRTLKKETVKEKDGSNSIYYVGGGMVLNEDKEPLLILSWKVRKRVEDETGMSVCEVICPVVRINPECFIEKDTLMDKFLTGKFFRVCVNSKIKSWVFPCTSRFRITKEEYPLEIVIEKSPFPIYAPQVPDIEITNEDIIQQALNVISYVNFKIE